MKRKRQSKTMRLLREQLHYWQGVANMEARGLKNTRELCKFIGAQMRVIQSGNGMERAFVLDTPEHIRLAWRMANLSVNQKSGIDYIKARIVKAWKEKIDPAGPPQKESKDAK